MGADGSRSPTNLQQVRATACFSRGFWLRAATRSKHSRRFPPFHLKNRRTFTHFTTCLTLFVSIRFLTPSQKRVFFFRGVERRGAANVVPRRLLPAARDQ